MNERLERDSLSREIYRICGSHPERLFAVSLSDLDGASGMLVMPNGILRIEFDVDSIGVCSATFQAKIACGDDLDRQLRVDFLVSSPRASLVVEVDGHQWHERTQEQAIRDRKRDRDLVSVGQIPIRFMAIEVMRNPDSCVNEAISTLSLLHLYAVDQERAWART